jgi:hypothetical protein
MKRAMRRRRIDHSNSLVLDKTYGLARRVIRQAQDDEVGTIYHVVASLRVLSPRRVDRNKLEIGSTVGEFASRWCRLRRQ